MSNAVPRSYRWSSRFVVGLIAATAALTVAGALATFLPLSQEWRDCLYAVCVIALASAAGLALAVSNAAVTLAQHILATDPKRSGTLAMAIGCAIATGLVSIGGVHLGWELLVSRTGRIGGIETWMVDLAGLALGVVKPAMSWVIAACCEIDAAEAKQADAVEADRAHSKDMLRIESMARVEEARARAAQPVIDFAAEKQVREWKPAAKPRPASRRVAETAALAALAAATPAAASPADRLAPPPAEQHEPAGRLHDPIVTGRLLISQGVTTRNALCKRVPGLTKYRAELLLDEMSPGWRARRNVA